MKAIDEKHVILSNENQDMFLTANMKMDPPILYLTKNKKEAILWNLIDDKVCNENCNLFWDLYDESEPRPTLYKNSNSYNQLWSISIHNSQVSFISKNYNVKYPSLSYRGDSVFFGKEPRPFTILISMQVSDNLQVDFSIENAKKLWSTYDRGYAFPIWTIEKLQEHYYELAPKCRIYFSNGSLSEAKKLALQREPVNIEMERHYDEYRMEELFGWSRGYYGNFFKNTGRLAPNLAIYCPTLVKVGNHYQKIHIINSIGYAFDSKKQPDYLVLSKSSPSELYDRYKLVFEKIYRCAKDIGADTVVMSLVGAGVFAEHWPHLLENIWIPAFVRVQEYYGITTLLMAPENTKKIPNISRNIGLFPENIKRVENLNRTLFVNAWDPWSIAGNGNAKDNSLDGYVGRNSMVALLTWPLTNLTLLDSPIIEISSSVFGANVKKSSLLKQDIEETKELMDRLNYYVNGTSLLDLIFAMNNT